VKKEVRLLLSKATDSLVLSVELFNRPSNHGRSHGVLIFLDHAFEMFLKAAILHRNGKIRKPGEKHNLGFDACVRKALSNDQLKFLTDEQAITLQIINGYRDAAQHDLLTLSEQNLYIQSQAGLTLFRDLYKEVFDSDLRLHLSERVMPLSTTPPTDLARLFDSEAEEIKRLLRPGTRRGVEASARLRALEIMENAVGGEKGQPSQSRLRRLAKHVREGRGWEQIWPGVASLELTAHGHGPSLDLRFSKKEGVAVRSVPEGTPGAAVVAVKRVNELDYYSLNTVQLAGKIELTVPRTVAVVRYLDLQSDTDCFKEISIGKQKHKRYSPKSITRIRETLATTSIDEIWESHGIGKKRISM
jgi:hypothetical protein